MTLGGAAQLVAAHCPNERTTPRQAYIIPQPAALWPSPPQCFPAASHYF